MPKEKIYTVKLTELELNTIGAGLGKLPLEVALSIFVKLQQFAQSKS